MATCDACGGVDFNVTHTNGMVACVTARGSDVGIDAEALDRDIDLKLADICLSRQEHAWLKAQQYLSPRHAFLHLWTLKEAVIKAVGIGMTADLKAFTVLPFPPRIIETGPDFGGLQRWALWQLTPISPTAVSDDPAGRLTSDNPNTAGLLELFREPRTKVTRSVGPGARPERCARITARVPRRLFINDGSDV
jgi:hypothetical protein